MCNIATFQICNVGDVFVLMKLYESFKWEQDAVHSWLAQGKHVILSGLNGDFQRRPIGHMLTPVKAERWSCRGA